MRDRDFAMPSYFAEQTETYQTLNTCTPGDFGSVSTQARKTAPQC